MGKIFGISDNPVSTIDSALRPLTYKKPVRYPEQIAKNTNQADRFVPREKQNTSNPILKMRNGIGKLMSHFSKHKQ